MIGRCTRGCCLGSPQRTAVSFSLDHGGYFLHRNVDAECRRGLVHDATHAAPLMVSLVQAAGRNPRISRRSSSRGAGRHGGPPRLLLFTQSWMVVAAVALGVLTLFYIVSPWMLLALPSSWDSAR